MRSKVFNGLIGFINSFFLALATLVQKNIEVKQVTYLRYSLYT